MKIRSFVRVLLLLACNVSIAPYVYASDTIKIGVLSPLTGPLSSMGISSARAVELVADEYNNKGGLLGKTIEVISVDDECEPAASKKVAPQLIADTDFIIGSLCSGGTEAILPLFTKAEKILISPAATSPDLTLDNKNPYFMRTISHDLIQTDIATDFIANNLNAKRIALIDDNSKYGVTYNNIIENNINKNYPNIDISFRASATHGAVNYTNLAAIIASYEVDVLIWGGYYRGLAEISKKLAELNYKDIKIIGPDAIKNARYIENAHVEPNSTYASAPTEIVKNKIYTDAHAAYTKKYRAKANTYFENAYAATQAILDAVDKAKSTDTLKVANQLRANTVSTPIGNISFDEKGDIIGVGISIYKIEKNSFVPVYNM